MMDTVRLGPIRFFSTSEESRPVTLSVSASARIDTHLTLTGFDSQNAGVDPKQVTLTGSWLGDLGVDAPERIAEIEAEMANPDYQALVVGTMMLGFYRITSFSWSPITYGGDGTPYGVEYQIGLTEALS